MATPNYYEILEVEPTATPTEIKKAYRKLARLHHPDITHDDGSRDHFELIQAAYQVLSEPEDRKDYDAIYGYLWAEKTKAAKEKTEKESSRVEVQQRIRTNPQQFSFDEGAFAGPAGARFNSGEVVPEAEEPPPPGLLNKIKRAFGKDTNQIKPWGGNARRRPEASPEEEIQRRARRHPPKKEPDKSNSAAPPPPEAARVFQFTIDGLESLRGAVREVAVTDGHEPRVFRVKIPAGVTEGNTLRLKLDDGETIQARVHIVAHRLVEREGLDIILKIPVTLREAIDGVDLEIPTLSGPTNVRIPPKTLAEKRFRLKGKGVVNAADGTSGDLYVVTNIAIPEEIPDSLKESLRQTDSFYPNPVRANLPKTLA